MKLKEYVENLVEFLEDNPEYADLDVCYSSDDEGNNHCKGVFSPEAGVFEGEYNGDFTREKSFEDEGDLEDRLTKEDIDCVRIN